MAKKSPKPMSDSEYAGWREVLAGLDAMVKTAEQDTRNAVPPGAAFLRGRRAAMTKARDAVLADVRREQERRINAEAAESVRSAHEAAETGIEP